MAKEPGFEPLFPGVAVRDALTRLEGLAESVRGVTDADLIALAGEVEHLGRTLDALRTRVAGEIDARSRRGDDDPLAGRYGCRTGLELLERLTGASNRELRGRVRLDEATRTRTTLTGQDLDPRCVHVAAGLASGLLGAEAAAGIVKAVDTARRGGGHPDRVELMERHLVALATGTITPDTDPDPDTDTDTDTGPDTDTGMEAGVGDADAMAGRDPLEELAPVPPLSVNVHAQAWIDVLTADGTEPDPDRPERERTLTLTPLPSGAFRVNGTLVPEAGALLQNLLSAHTNPARNVTFTETRDTGSGEVDPSDDPGADGAEFGPVMPDTRSPGQKRHDAFFAMIQAASRAAETPALGGAAPTVMIHITADDLTTTDTDTGAGRRGIAHLDGVDAPVPATVARRIGCTGDILRALFTPEGRILELRSIQRCFTPTQRKAIVARDGGCIIPGCTIPAAWCEIHHVQDHAQGGPTETDNGVLLCWWHHHHLDTSGWNIHMHHGVPYIVPPRWIDRDCTPRPAQGSATRIRTRIRRTLTRIRT
ncbi:HNH endonuclease signature motif containing protein [Microbacterium sp. JZ37]|uniref:HNH endonuclease signature motif containing protein n=1 Tax=Microbacterium sp. JZ37 TaxID=2654193 RepID=UPI002B484F0E|nr:DUF222 domain-containing protein [Microbacterium sp. JZ37]